MELQFYPSVVEPDPTLCHDCYTVDCSVRHELVLHPNNNNKTWFFTVFCC